MQRLAGACFDGSKMSALKSASVGLFSAREPLTKGSTVEHNASMKTRLSDGTNEILLMHIST